jgi:hypothetical protein
MKPHILLWSPRAEYLADLLSASPTIRFTYIKSATQLAETLPDADGIVMLGHL